MVTGDEQSLEAQRGRLLIEESREVVVLLDADDRVIHASRRARETYPDVADGRRLPGPIRDGRRPTEILEVPLVVGDRVERLVYIGRPGDMHAYEELRAGFTAAVSHELRTPLARLLTLIESIELPGADMGELVDLARGQVDQMGELIDDVLFLGELETGHAVVGLGSSAVLPIFREVVAESAERADVAGIALSVTGDETVEIAVRPRMIQVLARNFIQNALRYAGPDCSLELDVRRRRGWVQIRARDTGIGTPEEALPRLFERFYRADPARASRGTGLGLAIVKHICNSAGGYVVAENTEPHGLTIRLMFPEGDSVEAS
jgi:two-component system phosphate regulon sensor histidine kinase PhoR